MWNAHVERARAAAQTFKAGWPSPRVAGRDPYALRALVLIACIATFVAAGGERWKRVAAAFDWQGVVLPANFRVDAWVTPPAYTGKPPIILAGIHPGETARAADAAGEPVTVPAGSTLVVRATGKLHLDVAGSGGVTAVNEATHAPSGTEEHRFKIAATGTATLRGLGDDLTWAFNATPDKPPTIALTKDPEQQNRGAMLLSYRVEDDYGATEAHATFARKDVPAAKGDGPHPLYGPPDFSLILPQARTKSGVAQTIKDVTDHPWAGAEVVMTLTARDEGGNEGRSEPFTARARVHQTAGEGAGRAEPAGAPRPVEQAARRPEKPRHGPEPAGQAGPAGPRPRRHQRPRRAGDAMSEAEASLGEGNADSAVDSQGRALEALRKGAQGLAQSMQQQMGQGPGPGRTGRMGPPRAQQDTDPLGRPLRGREYGDDYTVKVPGEIDVQRARRIIEELRRRFGDVLRPQDELDYIERLLKDY